MSFFSLCFIELFTLLLLRFSFRFFSFPTHNNAFVVLFVVYNYDAMSLEQTEAKIKGKKSIFSIKEFFEKFSHCFPMIMIFILLSFYVLMCAR